MLENLEWLTQKTEDPKSNKKVPISTSTPCFQVYPPFLAKNFVPPPPQVTQSSEGPWGEWGFPTMLYIWVDHASRIHSLNSSSIPFLFVVSFFFFSFLIQSDLAGFFLAWLTA